MKRINHEAPHCAAASNVNAVVICFANLFLLFRQKKKHHKNVSKLGEEKIGGRGGRHVADFADVPQISLGESKKTHVKNMGTRDCVRVFTLFLE
jgi:hypothetical protein